MRNRERPSTTDHGGEFYQTPTDCSEEEIQRSFEFMKKLQQADDDQRIFRRYGLAMKFYQSGSLTYMSLKRMVESILRDHQGLLDEFLQLLSDFASPARRNHSKKENVKPDVERTVGFLNKIEALGENVYKAFVSALAFPGDIEVLIKQLDEILPDHTSLKEEFETFLVDSHLLRRKHDLEMVVTRPVTEDTQANKQKINKDCVNVTPSYWIRPEAEEGSSCDENLNGKYYSVGSYDPEDALQKRSQPFRDVRMNNLEDKCMEKDMLLRDLASVIEYGVDFLEETELFEKPPIGFNRVLQWFCRGRRVPQKFKTYPEVAVALMLPTLQSKVKEMRMAKELKLKRVYDRKNLLKDNMK